jgi:hypothetical protein
MTDQLPFFIFGDQTFDVQPHLKDLLAKRDNPVLLDFMTKSYNAIRNEMYKLPEQVRDDLARFTCVDDLVFWNQIGRRCIPLDMAVTCMYQLGTFIGYV